MKIINKLDPTKVIGIDFPYSEENLLAYFGDDYLNWVEIPDDNKEYIFTDGEITEKPIDLEKLKQQKISEIQTAYTNSFLQGFDTSINIKFHIKPEDQLNYIGAMIATASLQDTDTLPFPLIDFYGATHQITVGQSRLAYLEIVNYKAQMELKRANLLLQINNATVETVGEVEWQEV